MDAGRRRSALGSLAERFGSCGGARPIAGPSAAASTTPSLRMTIFGGPSLRMTGSGLGERYFISKLLLTTPGPACEPTAHSLIGADFRQSTQVVCALRAPHCGHTAPVAKVS